MSNEEVIQKYIDGLTTGQSLNHLSSMIDNIDDAIIEVVDQKWAIEDNMLDPLISQMDAKLSSLNKSGSLYKGDNYGLKNIEEWAWYEDTGINSGYIHYVDDNTLYIQGDRRSIFTSGKYILVNYYTGKQIPRKVETSVLSGSDTYIHLSNNSSDDLWDNPYYDKNKATYPTCVDPNVQKSICDCYELTERPLTTTSSTTTITSHEYEPGVFEIVINSDYINESLEYFPLFLNLCNSSGINNLDVTEIFNEVGDNWLKVYIQDSYPFNSGNNLWTEVDSWESSGNFANLYVNVPFVDNTYYTRIYLYFGLELEDNSYIGCSNGKYRNDDGTYINLQSGYNVWNTYENRCVLHLSERNDGKNIKDSVNISRYGGFSNSTTMKKLDYNRFGYNYIYDNHITYRTSNYGNTFDIIVNLDNKFPNDYTKNLSLYSGQGNSSFYVEYDTGKVVYWDNVKGYLKSEENIITSGRYHFFTTLYNGKKTIYVNGINVAEYDGVSIFHSPNHYFLNDGLKGYVDEIRLYNHGESPSYALATYYDRLDSLCYYYHVIK